MICNGQGGEALTSSHSLLSLSDIVSLLPVQHQYNAETQDKTLWIATSQSANARGVDVAYNPETQELAICGIPYLLSPTKPDDIQTAYSTCLLPVLEAVSSWGEPKTQAADISSDAVIPVFSFLGIVAPLLAKGSVTLKGPQLTKDNGVKLEISVPGRQCPLDIIYGKEGKIIICGVPFNETEDLLLGKKPPRVLVSFLAERITSNDLLENLSEPDRVVYLDLEAALKPKNLQRGEKVYTAFTSDIQGGSIEQLRYFHQQLPKMLFDRLGIVADWESPYSIDPITGDRKYHYSTGVKNLLYICKAWSPVDQQSLITKEVYERSIKPVEAYIGWQICETLGIEYDALLAYTQGASWDTKESSRVITLEGGLKITVGRNLKVGDTVFNDQSGKPVDITTASPEDIKKFIRSTFTPVKEYYRDHYASTKRTVTDFGSDYGEPIGQSLQCKEMLPLLLYYLSPKVLTVLNPRNRTLKYICKAWKSLPSSSILNEQRYNEYIKPIAQYAKVQICSALGIKISQIEAHLQSVPQIYPDKETGGVSIVIRLLNSTIIKIGRYIEIGEIFLKDPISDDKTDVTKIPPWVLRRFIMSHLQPSTTSPVA